METRPLRVAMVTAWPRDPESPHGGIEALSVNLVRSLAKMADVRVEVVTTDGACVAPEVVEAEGVRVHRLPRKGGHVLTEAVGPGRRQMLAYLRTLAPDLVHSHDVFGLMVKGLDLPRVFTINGFIHADTRVNGEGMARLRSWLWKRVETAGWADQPHIISVTPYVRERLHGIYDGIIHDIENPAGEAFFSVPRAEVDGTIFSAALVDRRKNPLVLVEALGRVISRGVDARLRLAGAARDPDYLRQVQERITALGLNDRVALLGEIKSGQVREELSRASVFALASLEENAPVGIEEAMAVGLPIVSSNRCGMPYMIRHGETGYLVDPHDAEDVAWCLVEVLRDRDRRRTMGERARQMAADCYHPDSVARRTVEVYRRVLRGRSRTSS